MDQEWWSIWWGVKDGPMTMIDLEMKVDDLKVVLGK